jgi:hypothetical protein
MEELLEDLAVVGALALAGLIVDVVTKRGRSARHFARTAAGHIRSGLKWRLIWPNRSIRLVVLLVLVLLAGWGATFARLGLADTGRMASFGPPPQHTRVCQRMQREVHHNLEYQLRIEVIEVEEDGTLPSGFRHGCPYGGELFVDDEGRLTCSEHGAAPLPTLHVPEEP